MFHCHSSFRGGKCPDDWTLNRHFQLPVFWEKHSPLTFVGPFYWYESTTSLITWQHPFSDMQSIPKRSKSYIFNSISFSHHPQTTLYKLYTPTNWSIHFPSLKKMQLATFGISILLWPLQGEAFAMFPLCLDQQKQQLRMRSSFRLLSFCFSSSSVFLFVVYMDRFR